MLRVPFPEVDGQYYIKALPQWCFCSRAVMVVTLINVNKYKTESLVYNSVLHGEFDESLHVNEGF